MRILIIEDEKDIVKPLKRFLEDQGFAVDFATNGKKGLYLAQVNNYDCILLDLNLPKLDGVDLAKRLRNPRHTAGVAEESNTTPIIMVTARSQMYDKLNGFGVGADDYVTKPFDLKELLARIKSVVKRNSVNKTKSLKFHNFELKPSQNQVLQYKGSKIVKEFELSNKEVGVLEYLIRNKGEIVSTEKILEHVWDREVDMFTDTVKTHVKTLRQKIDLQKKIIKTVRGKGYKINS